MTLTLCRIDCSGLPRKAPIWARGLPAHPELITVGSMEVRDLDGTPLSIGRVPGKGGCLHLGKASPHLHGGQALIYTYKGKEVHEGKDLEVHPSTLSFAAMTHTRKRPAMALTCMMRHDAPRGWMSASCKLHCILHSANVHWCGESGAAPELDILGWNLNRAPPPAAAAQALETHTTPCRLPSMHMALTNVCKALLLYCPAVL